MRLGRYIAFAALLLTTSAYANSLWTPGGANMFVDLKGCKVGDVITVLVVESSSTSQAASTSVDKKLDHKNDVGVGTLLSNIPAIEFSSAQKGAANGSTSRTSNFTAKITATVTKVLPNGNLEIEANRSISTNSERQNIKLTGTIRQQDVAPDNTVLSTYLADAKIESSGKGPIGDRQKEGLISKLLRFLF
jgi:flagellar L-ring protein FlgH